MANGDDGDVLMLGDHDATALAFGVLGIAPEELAVVDIDPTCSRSSSRAAEPSATSPTRGSPCRRRSTTASTSS